MEIRFHLDESVSRSLAAGLRSRGLNVTTTAEAGLLGAPDEEQLQHATVAGRVIVTHDNDFLRLHSQGVSHAGIAYCHQTKHGVGALVNRLADLRRTRTAEEVTELVVFL